MSTETKAQPGTDGQVTDGGKESLTVTDNHDKRSWPRFGIARA